MTKILFVCHGNICRSPTAEFVFRDLAAQQGVGAQFLVSSAATTAEEIGNPVYPPARRRLAQAGISCAGKTAVQMTRADYDRYDLLLGMDPENLRDMTRIAGGDPDGKIGLLLRYTGTPRAVADPWYTGDFETAYQDILAGCRALLHALLS